MDAQENRKIGLGEVEVRMDGWLLQARPRRSEGIALHGYDIGLRATDVLWG
jgi:hypothetical protein